MLLIHTEDRDRVTQALDHMRAAILQVTPCGADEMRAVHTVTAGVAEALTILSHLKPADDHLRLVVDKIFANNRCPLADDQ